MSIPFQLIFAHSKRTWLRTLLTAGSVFVAVFIFGALRMVIQGMEKTLEAANESRIISSSAISLFAHLPARLYPEMKARPGVKAVTHWTWYGGKYIDDNPKHKMWARFGVEPESFHKVFESDMTLSDEAWKRFETTRIACVVGKDLAKSENLEIGMKVPITGNFFLGRIEPEIVGIYTTKNHAFDQKSLFFHWDYMNEVSKKEGGRCDSVSTFTMLLEDPTASPRLIDTIDTAYENSEHRTRTLPERMFQAQFNSMWGGMPLFFALLGGAALVACLMVTANTMVLNARERIQEVGVLKTLGFTPRVIAVTTLVEGFLLCIVGGGLAISIIRLADGWQLPLVFIVASVPMSTVAEGLGIAAGLGLLSGIFPAVIASRMDIVTAIRRRA